MLDLWRPPNRAGDPIGCLATTYTFAPGLFDEQCLARFLEIESEPNREDLAFLLERESILGRVYAGVIVDYTQAGVEHSLRWDVLPVRIPGGKQHAKLSVLAWSHHIRVIVASANLTENGYRSNYEVGAAIDISAQQGNVGLLDQAIVFLKDLLLLVPGAAGRPPELTRAGVFLEEVKRQADKWTTPRGRSSIRQQLVFTLPTSAGKAGRGSLEEAFAECRRRGGSPNSAKLASPFFDDESGAQSVTASLCKQLARGGSRNLTVCVPAKGGDDDNSLPRLAAPIALLLTPQKYQTNVTVETLPELDPDKNRRPWHAKMLTFRSESYSALMIGSSNFTGAGMGIGRNRNAEANLLTVVDRVAYNREIREIESVWPATSKVIDPDSVEWLGSNSEIEEEEDSTDQPLPPGFVSACYRAGDERRITLRLDPPLLPSNWHIHACGSDRREVLSDNGWRQQGGKNVVDVAWEPAQPPEKILVRWEQSEAFMPLNVEDSRKLPPPPELGAMSADDMLWILASADPSAAFRLWAKKHQPTDLFDADLDSATPLDLDPLRRYDLQATFLHRIRRRARVLAQLRANLQRPVWGKQALEWRLTGLIGVKALADLMLRDLESTDGLADEGLLTLADFLIILREVDYQPGEGSLPKADFEKVFRPFLTELVDKVALEIEGQRDGISEDLMNFWKRVIAQCRK
jgi:hypothetical protein